MKLDSFFDEKDISFEVFDDFSGSLDTAPELDESKLVRSLVLKRQEGYLHCLLPSSSNVDEEALPAAVKLVSPVEVEQVTGFEPEGLHPFYSGMRKLVDLELLKKEVLYFEAGESGRVVKLGRDDFFRALESFDFEVTEVFE
ncbi:MAG: YbaK/EbsC family protein [Candidatus Nanohaloarchaeota archaeon QJJ-9]|nr:YbaK/EbsC family protein [Candidatus Nanohaloarchaeota archaeon QJJ-9]